jgi:GDP-L-fucose synthase
MEKDSKIFVAGVDTLIGAAIARRLHFQGFENLVGVGKDQPDLTSAEAVDAFFAQWQPEYVFLTAGKSGGIRANQKYPATLMLNNLLCECHVVDAAYRYRVTKLLYLASSCSYPKFTPQPMQVEALFTGPVEPTNAAYATAKLAGLVLCQAYRQQYGVNFITGIPADAFGPGDDFSPEDSHVVAALIRRFYAAKMKDASVIEIWGSGKPRREFVYVDDLADGAIFVMHNYDNILPINIGTGRDFSIRELAEAIQNITGYSGNLEFDCSKPDGMPFKLLDSSLLQSLGWSPAVPFIVALEETCQYYQSNIQILHSKEWL